MTLYYSGEMVTHRAGEHGRREFQIEHMGHLEVPPRAFHGVCLDFLGFSSILFSCLTAACLPVHSGEVRT